MFLQIFASIADEASSPVVSPRGSHRLEELEKEDDVVRSGEIIQGEDKTSTMQSIEETFGSCHSMLLI